MNNPEITTRSPKTSRGFSLVEMMVAVALFTIVAMVSISALLSVNDANRKAQTMRAIIDNLNFAVENMARNLRVGSTYNCGTATPIASPRDCINGDSSIAFESYVGDPGNPNDQVVYRLDTDAPTNKGQIMKSGDSGSTFLPLTPFVSGLASQPLVVDYLKFYVTGSASSDGKQPRVVIVIGGTASYNEKIKTRFLMQTSVSQRHLDS
jgi:prepilin-type N-terminal cleavage/methylation domain-containing protein